MPDPNNADRIQSLLAELRQKPPLEKQKQIRVQLRALGHYGGLRTDPTPPTVWKIATARGEWWPNFRNNQCAYIGFNLPTQDLSNLSEPEIETLLQQENKGGGVDSVYPFIHEIEIGDIIVAMGGVRSALGVGIITSDYIPPNAPDNPSPDPDRRQSRRVDWLLDQPVDFDEQLFNQTTLTRISPDKWQRIQSQYRTAYPADPTIAAALTKLGAEPMSAQTANALTSTLLELTRSTRNVLLYGPPGTGKTYNVRAFESALLQGQLSKAQAASARLLETITSFKWWEIIWASMYLAGKDDYDVTEIMNLSIMKDYISQRTVKEARPVVWVALNQRSPRDSSTVKLSLSDRREPALFDKTENSRWHLTQIGNDFARDEGREILDRIQAAKTTPADFSDFSRFVTFHQSFAYEEFVEGLKPSTSDAEADQAGPIQYKIQPGIFRELCKRAEKAWRDAGAPKEGTTAPKFLLIIDEINRANIAKVFGELITLIEDDKRLGCNNPLAVKLPYSQDDFGVPPNLYILGTLNTADRSIAQLDLALRRRFAFVEMMPQYDLPELNTFPQLNIPALLKKLNDHITTLLDRDHQIGHAYLLNLHSPDDLHFAWTYKILPLLQEYFYNDPARLHALLGTAFVQPQNSTDPDAAPRYQLLTHTPSALLAALKTFLDTAPTTNEEDD